MTQTLSHPDQIPPHGFVTRTIHWLSAGLLGYGYFKGLDNPSQLADPTLLQFEVIFAVILGGLFLARFFWTHKVAGSTRLPADAPKWEKWGAKSVHLGLYAAVFGIVLSGLGIAGLYASGITGGLLMGTVIGLHEASLAALPVLLLAHILGAFWHKLIRRDGVMESMTGSLDWIPMPLRRKRGA